MNASPEGHALVLPKSTEGHLRKLETRPGLVLRLSGLLLILSGLLPLALLPLLVQNSMGSMMQYAIVCLAAHMKGTRNATIKLLGQVSDDLCRAASESGLWLGQTLGESHPCNSINHPVTKASYTSRIQLIPNSRAM